MIRNYNEEQFEIMAYQRSKDGNHFCGDAYCVITKADYMLCAVVDGLGSGEGAYESAQAVVSVIESLHHENVDTIVGACNSSLLSKRGAVLTLIKIYFETQEVCYCNFGNIGFVLHQPDGETVQPIPRRGYLSGKKQVVRSDCFAYQPGSIFMMYSDGVKKPLMKKALTTLEDIQKVDEVLSDIDERSEDDQTLIIGRLK